MRQINEAFSFYAYDMFYMIQLIRRGEYSLIETKGETKILSLDNQASFAWVSASEIGEILVSTHKKHWVDHILALGKYRLYKVKDEIDLIDTLHLELFVGEGVWQGYLLPTGFPNKEKMKSRIIPTREIITKTAD